MRYLIFAHDNYYPNVGASDLVGTTDNLPDAVIFLKSLGRDSGEILDTTSMCIVWNLKVWNSRKPSVRRERTDVEKADDLALERLIAQHTGSEATFVLPSGRVAQFGINTFGKLKKTNPPAFSLQPPEEPSHRPR